MLKSYPYPFLDDFRSDYVEGVSYKLDFVESKNNIVKLKHILEGNSFINTLHGQNKITFAITIVAKQMMFRETYKSDSIEHSIDISSINQHQKDLYYLGQIIYTGNKESYTLKASDGLTQMYDGETIVLERGNVLGEYWLGPDKSIGNMIYVHKDSGVKYGFNVVLDLDGDGEFRVNMAENLFDNFNRNKSNILGNNLATHILGACLYELKKAYANNDSGVNDTNDEASELLRNFIIIEQVLKSKKLPSFVDENFEPNDAAVALSPIIFDLESRSEYE